MPALWGTDPSPGLHEPVVVLLRNLPTAASSTPHFLRVDELTHAPSGGTLEDGPYGSYCGVRPHFLKGWQMAKALLGYLNNDAANASMLSAENRRLRARISELETVVVRLAEENDALVASKATLEAEAAAPKVSAAMQLA